MVVDRPSGAGLGGGGGERIEVLSPEGSFALHHGKYDHCFMYSLINTRPSEPSPSNANSLSPWVESIRNARAAHLEALAMSNPDSTLSASTSGVHLRRALRAFASENDDIDYEPKLEEAGGRNETTPPCSRLHRAQLDNFLPPVWIPDARTDTCMRCGRSFGLALDLSLGDVFGWGFGKGSTSGAEGKQGLETERAVDDDNQIGKRVGRVLGDGNTIASFVGVWFIQRVLERYLILEYWSDAKNAHGFHDFLHNTKRR